MRMHLHFCGCVLSINANVGKAEKSQYDIPRESQMKEVEGQQLLTSLLNVCGGITHLWF